jgi:hypothetical protein
MLIPFILQSGGTLSFGNAERGFTGLGISCADMLMEAKNNSTNKNLFMMLKLICNIEIQGKDNQKIRFDYVHQIEVKTSRKNLTDTAVIKVPRKIRRDDSPMGEALLLTEITSFVVPFVRKGDVELRDAERAERNEKRFIAIRWRRKHSPIGRK